jgi:hypothetical protein
MPGSALQMQPSREPAGWAAVLSLCAILGATCPVGQAAATQLPQPASPAAGLARVSGGFKIGLGLAQHQGVEDPRLPYTVDSSWRQGFTAAVFLHFPVTDRFGLQQEVVYVRKGSRQAIGVDILEIPATLDVRYDLTYLEIPLLMRFVWLLGPRLDLYTLGGFSFALKIDDRYRLDGVVSDGEQTIPVSADAPMDEVDIFDFAFVYGLGLEMSALGRRVLLEYRFSLSLEALSLPTYAYVPFGTDDRIRIDNDPVPLRNQAHAVLLGIRF